MLLFFIVNVLCVSKLFFITYYCLGQTYIHVCITSSATTCNVIIFLSLAVAGLTCNFDNGLCEWVPVHGNLVQWKIGTGSTQDPSSGPDGDHSQTGSNVYFVSHD